MDPKHENSLQTQKQPAPEFDPKTCPPERLTAIRGLARQYFSNYGKGFKNNLTEARYRAEILAHHQEVLGQAPPVSFYYFRNLCNQIRVALKGDINALPVNNVSPSSDVLSNDGLVQSNAPKRLKTETGYVEVRPKQVDVELELESWVK